MHPAGKREISLAPLQARHGLVYRNQGGRAGGVQGHCRSLQVQRESDPSDSRVEGTAADHVEAGGRFRTLPGSHGLAAVVVITDSCINTGAASPQAIRVQARVFQCPPARLQHQPLLGIQQLRLHRRNTEEGGIKQVNFVQVGAEQARPVLHLRSREQLPGSSFTGPRFNLRYRVFAAIEQAPVRREVRRAGKAARHTHYRDRLFCSGHGLLPYWRPDSTSCSRNSRMAATHSSGCSSWRKWVVSGRKS